MHRAMSSIFVATWPCPYPKTFTSEEWKKIMDSNPFRITHSVLSESQSSSLSRATNLYALGLEHDFQPGDTELDRVAARILNNMCAELKFLSMSE